jgi:hypothetical protein
MVQHVHDNPTNSDKESGGNMSYLVEQSYSNLALYLNRDSLVSVVLQLG